MSLIVVLVGLLMIGTSIALMLSPAGLREFIHRILGPRWLPLVSALRIAVGLLFVLAAPFTRLPALIWFLGIVAIIAGIFILFLGSTRTQLIANWWLKRSDNVLRLWALVALLFGVLLVWAGV